MNAAVCARILDIVRQFEMSASITLEPSFLAVHTIGTASSGTQKLVCIFFIIYIKAVAVVFV